MKTSIRILIGLVSLGVGLLGQTAVAAEAAPELKAPPVRQAVGVSLGWVVANGLSYRRYFNSSFFQTSFAGAVDKDRDQSYLDLAFSYGTYLNYAELMSGEHPVGLTFIMGMEGEHDNNRTNDLVYTDTTVSPNELHIGAGFGLELGNPAKKGLSVSLNVIYTGSFRGEQLEFVRLGLLPSAALHFNL